MNRDIPRRAVDMFKVRSVETRILLAPRKIEAADVQRASDKNEVWLLANKSGQRLTLARLDRWPGTVSLGLPAFMDKDGTQPEVHWNLECTETSKRHDTY